MVRIVTVPAEVAVQTPGVMDENVTGTPDAPGVA
jgi:hypothetical protein